MRVTWGCLGLGLLLMAWSTQGQEDQLQQTTIQHNQRWTDIDEQGKLSTDPTSLQGQSQPELSPEGENTKRVRPPKTKRRRRMRKRPKTTTEAAVEEEQQPGQEVAEQEVPEEVYSRRPAEDIQRSKVPPREEEHRHSRRRPPLREEEINRELTEERFGLHLDEQETTHRRRPPVKDEQLNSELPEETYSRFYVGEEDEPHRRRPGKLVEEATPGQETVPEEETKRRPPKRRRRPQKKPEEEGQEVREEPQQPRKRRKGTRKRIRTTTTESVREEEVTTPENDSFPSRLEDHLRLGGEPELSKPTARSRLTPYTYKYHTSSSTVASEPETSPPPTVQPFQHLEENSRFKSREKQQYNHGYRYHTSTAPAVQELDTPIPTQPHQLEEEHPRFRVRERPHFTPSKQRVAPESRQKPGDRQYQDLKTAQQEQNEKKVDPVDQVYPTQTTEREIKQIQNRKNLFSNSRRLPATSAVIRRRLRPRLHKNSTEVTAEGAVIMSLGKEARNSEDNRVESEALIPEGFTMPPEILSPRKLMEEIKRRTTSTTTSSTIPPTTLAEEELNYPRLVENLTRDNINEEIAKQILSAMEQDFEKLMTTEIVSTTMDTTEVPQKNLTSIHDHILDLLKTRSGTSRLSRILEQRNMTLDQLIEHRERGASQFHFPDLFPKKEKEEEVRTEPPRWRIIPDPKFTPVSVRGVYHEVYIAKLPSTLPPDLENIIISENEGRVLLHREGTAVRQNNHPFIDFTKLPAGVRSAIIISTGILLLAIFGFLSVLISCRVRQRRARMRAKQEILGEGDGFAPPSQRSVSPVLTKVPNHAVPVFTHSNIHSNTTSHRHYYLWRTLRKTFQYE